MEKWPKISIWITSTGRINLLKSTIESWIKHCTYPNCEMVIIESQMTKISRKFFALEYVDEEATADYINSLEKTYPAVKFKIFIQPYKPLGQIYDQLMGETEDYFFNIEDDLVAVCDPKDQFIDGVKLLKADPKLLGIRGDLRDCTLFEGCPRFPDVGEAEGMKYMIIKQFSSGGAQLMDAQKVRDIGGFITTHTPDKYIETELDQSAKMRQAGMYTAVNLKYWGVLKHMGHHGVQGGDRSWTINVYNDLERNGWYGGGKNRKPQDHHRDYYIQHRINNGKP